ncbi:MAG TPA: SH3 domain-containing protein [Thermoanaerobaculia bacterium]
MKRLALAFLALAACTKEAPVVTGTFETREPVAVRYVGSPELNVYEKADDKSPVMATYQNGEAMSILVDKGEWVEVRTGDRSGWAKASDLTTAEGKTAQDEDPQPKFKVMPMPVSAPSARGEIYLEADVNSDGEVVNIRTITNTTGSDALANQNAAALRSAKFYPIVVKGERKAFKYYHKVTY